LVAPGTGTTNTPEGGTYVAPDLDGYRLAAGSPAVASGRVVESAAGLPGGRVTANAGQDLWGQPVTADAVPNRGADNAQSPLAPELSYTVSAQVRCQAGKAYLAVTLSNTDQTAFSVTFGTVWGSRVFPSVAADKYAYHSFSTQASAVAAGQVLLGIGATVDGTPVSQHLTLPHPGVVCG
jgi:hypothetical protein